jgi:ABC-2 type transport system ATP-binding protein
MPAKRCPVRRGRPDGAGLRQRLAGYLCRAVEDEHGVSVVLSSHLIADLERVCDYLVILVASRVRLAGEVTDLLSAHHRLSGPRRDPRSLPTSQEVIEESHTDKQSTFLVRTSEPILDPTWSVKPVTLDDLVLAYLSNPLHAERVRQTEIGVVR